VPVDVAIEAEGLRKSYGKVRALAGSTCAPGNNVWGAVAWSLGIIAVFATPLGGEIQTRRRPLSKRP
jgi:hypothetical protein